MITTLLSDLLLSTAHSFIFFIFNMSVYGIMYVSPSLDKENVKKSAAKKNRCVFIIAM